MTIKTLFTAIVLSFTVANTSTDAKASIPVAELSEAIHLAKDGYKLLKPIVKPVAKKAVKGIVRFVKKRKQQWDNYRAVRQAKKNNYVTPARILADLDMNTLKATTKAAAIDFDTTQVTVSIKNSKSVPVELAEEGRITKPAPLLYARSLPADLTELGL